jgi:hypothetical protein
MAWQDYESTPDAAGPWVTWVDFFAVAIGAGAMLLMLHLLGVLALVQHWATLL